MSSKKWKDALLSSSLPLEHLVAKKLAQSSFHIEGEYSYTRQSEQDVKKEFSVDLLARLPLVDEAQHGHWGNLDVLIECKYTWENMMWIFSPHPTTLSPISILKHPVTINQYLCTRRIDYDHPFYHDVKYCLRGTQFDKEGGKKKDDPSGISKGISQLRYATPSLVLDGISYQITAPVDNSLHIQIVCPILVTSAPLYVINSELDALKDFRDASELSDVAEEVDVLIVSQASGPQLQEYCGNLFDTFLADNRVAGGYMEALGKILVKKGAWEDNTVPGVRDLLLTMLSSSEAILVVNYDALDNQLAKLRDAIIHCADRSLLRYTTLREDREIAAAGTYYYLYFTDQDSPDR